MKTKEHPEYKQLVQWNKEEIDQSFSKSTCKTVVIVVIVDMVTVNMVFLVGLFLIIALMATVTSLPHLTSQLTS